MANIDNCVASRPIIYLRAANTPQPTWTSMSSPACSPVTMTCQERLHEPHLARSSPHPSRAAGCGLAAPQCGRLGAPSAQTLVFGRARSHTVRLDGGLIARRLRTFTGSGRLGDVLLPRDEVPSRRRQRHEGVAGSYPFDLLGDLFVHVCDEAAVTVRGPAHYAA